MSDTMAYYVRGSEKDQCVYTESNVIKNFSTLVPLMQESNDDQLMEIIYREMSCSDLRLYFESFNREMPICFEDRVKNDIQNATQVEKAEYLLRHYLNCVKLQCPELMDKFKSIFKDTVICTDGFVNTNKMFYQMLAEFLCLHPELRPSETKKRKLDEDSDGECDKMDVEYENHAPRSKVSMTAKYNAIGVGPVNEKWMMEES